MTPEIRYIQTFEYPKDLPADQKTPDRAKITKTAYKVSDKELAEENKTQRLDNILAELDDLKARIEKLEDIGKLG